MKKFVSVVLSLVLSLALAVPAFAAPPAAGKTAAKPSAKTSSVGVILNGRKVSFSDAVPVLRNGRTLVPFRALMETLGGTVNYGGDGFITCQLGDTKLSFKLDEKEVTITTATQAKTIEMDVPAAYSKGRTYVPVRFFAEALGYDVLWDSSTHSAVLLDRQALIEKVDQNFSVLNAALQKLQSDPAANYKSTATCQMDLDLTENSQKIAGSIKYNLSMISNASCVELSGTADASSLAAAMNLDEAVKNGSMSAAQAALLRSSLSAVSFDMILNLEKETAYFKMPLLTALTGGTSLTDSLNTWYQIPLDTGSAAAVSGVKPSVGYLLYSVYYSLAKQNGKNTAKLYDNVAETGNVLAALLGDGAGVKSGSSTTWTMDLTKLAKISAVGSKNFKTFDVTLTVTDSGELRCVFNIAAAGNSAMSAGGNLDVTSSGEQLSVKLTSDKTGTISLQINLTMEKTSDTPSTQPPAGAKIVNAGTALRGIAGTSQTSLAA